MAGIGVGLLRGLAGGLGAYGQLGLQRQEEQRKQALKDEEERRRREQELADAAKRRGEQVEDRDYRTRVDVLSSTIKGIQEGSILPDEQRVQALEKEAEELFHNSGLVTSAMQQGTAARDLMGQKAAGEAERWGVESRTLGVKRDILSGEPGKVKSGRDILSGLEGRYPPATPGTPELTPKQRIDLALKDVDSQIEQLNVGLGQAMVLGDKQGAQAAASIREEIASLKRQREAVLRQSGLGPELDVRGTIGRDVGAQKPIIGGFEEYVPPAATPGVPGAMPPSGTRGLGGPAVRPEPAAQSLMGQQGGQAAPQPQGLGLQQPAQSQGGAAGGALQGIPADFIAKGRAKGATDDEIAQAWQEYLRGQRR